VYGIVAHLIIQTQLAIFLGSNLRLARLWHPEAFLVRLQPMNSDFRNCFDQCYSMTLSALNSIDIELVITNVYLHWSFFVEEISWTD
jgi:hypothetical protein